MDLEKAYDRVDREAMWQVMRIYGIGGRVLRGIMSFYTPATTLKGAERIISKFDRCIS